MAFKTLLLSLLFLTNHSFPQAGSPVTNRQVWLNIGAGPVSYTAFSEGGSSSASLNYAFKNKIWSAYLTYSARTVNLNDQYGQCCYPDNDPRIWDAGLHFGFMAKRRFWFATFTGGPGIVKGEKGVGQQKEKFFTPALSFGTQLFFTLPAMGLGVYGFANLNVEKPYYGFTFSFQLGKLR